MKKTLNVDENGNLGIFHGATVKDMVDLGYMEVVQNSYSLIESISVGTNNFVSFMGFYFDQLVAIFNPSTGAYKGLGGFIAIGNIFPSMGLAVILEYYSSTFSYAWGLNLLPIPALDGGHAMFLMYEMISDEKPSDKFMETVQVIGFIICYH